MLGTLHGVHWLMASLLYGAGLRLIECLRLRVKDVDFHTNQIVVREGKGSTDRVAILPASVNEPLFAHLERVRVLHQRDRSAVLEECCCRVPFIASTPMPIASGVGSGDFQHRRLVLILARESRDDIICMNRFSNAP